MKYKGGRMDCTNRRYSERSGRQTMLMLASVASMIDQFNMPNIRLIQQLGCEVHVACNFKHGNTCDAAQIRKLQKTLQETGVVMHQWDCPRSIRSFGNCWNAYQQLLQLTGQYQYAWIHCHSPVGGALARLAAHKRGIRIIYTAHGFHFYKGAPVKNWLFYYPIEKFLAHWTDILVTINREDWRIARRKFRAGSIYLIPGVGIDTGRFCSGRCEREKFLRTFGLPSHARILLSVGELNKGKNHRMAIAALAALQHPDVYYIICGQGHLKEKLQQYADRLGIGTRVRMPGFQKDMPWIYQNTDIFVFPSVREGMPAALMEAMAAGLPCVVSDIRGNRELIGKDGGGRFSLDSPGQLQKMLGNLLEDTQLRMRCGLYNQKKIKQYDYSKVEKTMRRIYRKMIDL